MSTQNNSVKTTKTIKEDNGLLRVLTCGSVDDGKSTLIGRLLFDSKSILSDTLLSIDSTSKKKGLTQADLSLLTDGLQAEREQGITIDVAYRYFSTGTRKYIIADAPGHDEYTRNMVTAASTADLAIILIDARKGLLTQSKRHSYIAHLVGIKHLLIAVNKMDLVDYDEAVFNQIRADYETFATSLGIKHIQFIPLSALNGDMVVERGENLNWYQGETLMEILEHTEASSDDINQPFRFPVQGVNRPMTDEFHDFRGYMGRVASGSIQIGDTISVLPEGHLSKVKDIQLYGESLNEAICDQSVTILLEDEIDISRGDMLVKADELPTVAKNFAAMLCWLSPKSLDVQRKYLIQHTTRSSKAMVSDISYRLDINTLQEEETPTLKMNDIAKVSFKLAQALFFDAYQQNAAAGAFIVIDEASNNTVAAGMII